MKGLELILSFILSLVIIIFILQPKTIYNFFSKIMMSHKVPYHPDLPVPPAPKPLIHHLHHPHYILCNNCSII